MDAEVGDVVVFAEAVDHGFFRLAAHAATAHLVRGEQADAVGFHGQVVDAGSGLGPGVVPGGVQVHEADFAGAGGELDFGHFVERVFEASPQVVGDRVVQCRAAIVAKTDGAAGAVGMKAVPQQGNDGVHSRQFRQVIDLLLPVAGYDTGRHGRVQGWHFQFEPGGAVDTLGEIELIRVNRLGRTVVGLDGARHFRHCGVNRVQKGAFADAVVGVGNVGAQ